MRTVGDRHVVTNAQFPVPLLIAVEGAGTEASAAKSSSVSIDLLGGVAESGSIIEQVSVMFEVMHVDIETATSDPLHGAIRDCVARSRNQLERTFDPVPVVDVHQLFRELQPGRCLNIVRHDCACLFPIRPKPDEGNVAMPRAQKL